MPSRCPRGASLVPRPLMRETAPHHAARVFLIGDVEQKRERVHVPTRRPLRVHEMREVEGDSFHVLSLAPQREPGGVVVEAGMMERGDGGAPGF